MTRTKDTHEHEDMAERSEAFKIPGSTANAQASPGIKDVDLVPTDSDTDMTEGGQE